MDSMPPYNLPNLPFGSSDGAEPSSVPNVEMQDAADEETGSEDQEMENDSMQHSSSQDDGPPSSSPEADGGTYIQDEETASTQGDEAPVSDVQNEHDGEEAREEDVQIDAGQRKLALRDQFPSSDDPGHPVMPSSPRSVPDAPNEYQFAKAHYEKLRTIKTDRREWKEEMESWMPLVEQIKQAHAKRDAQAAAAAKAPGWQRSPHHSHTHPQPYDDHYNPLTPRGASDPKRTRGGDDDTTVPFDHTDQPFVAMEDDEPPIEGAADDVQMSGTEVVEGQQSESGQQPGEVAETNAPQPAPKKNKYTYKDVPYIPKADAIEFLRPGEIETVAWDKAPSAEVQTAVKAYWDGKFGSTDKERHPLKVWLAQDNWAAGFCVRGAASGKVSTRGLGVTRDEACDTCINKHTPCLVTGASLTQVVLLPEKGKVFQDAFDYVLGGDVPTSSRGGRKPGRKSKK